MTGPRDHDRPGHDRPGHERPGHWDQRDEARLDRLWVGIVAVVDAPRLGPVERVLRRLGVAPAPARLLTATPALTVSFLAAVVFSLAFAALALAGARDEAIADVLLALAPLVPVAGVAVAFGSDVDPAEEITRATPFAGTRLLALRTLSVVAAAVALLAVTLTLGPARGWGRVGWLLPSAALCGLTLLVGERVGATRAGAALAGAWVAAVVVVGAAGDPLTVLGPAVQAIAGATLVVSGLVATRRAVAA